MKHILFLSYGKDSMASLILALAKGYPLDEVVFIDIRYSEEVSGEMPVLASWIPEANKRIKEKYGITVKTLPYKVTFKDQFYKVKQKGNHIGDIYGFPFIIESWCNSSLKLQVIDSYISSIKEPVTQYVGIAYDEPKRYYRLLKKATDKVRYKSILFENHVTEPKAFEICKAADLLSPHYSTGAYRGGCWFCVKKSLADLYYLWKNYPEYFEELVKLEKDSPRTFKIKFTLPELAARFSAGYIPKRRKKQEKVEQLKIDLTAAKK